MKPTTPRHPSKPRPQGRPCRPQRGGGDAPGVAARLSALRLLDAAIRQGLPLESALDRVADQLDRSDRALARAIASGVLRHLTDLDAMIDAATARPLPDDAKARMVLRIALFQALGMGTPGHAAIATALPLVDGGPRRLVHGVFSAVSRAHSSLPSPPALPADVLARWAAAWGEAAVDQARAALAVPAPLDLTLKAETEDAPVGEQLAPRHVRIAAGQPVTELRGYAEGAWWVQDLSASIPARLLGPGEGRLAIDLCAAPGGKTMQLAAAGWRVTAVDSSESRLARLSDNLDRTALDATLVTGDVMDWAPDSPVDAILLDAPCSATGIFRRHPEVLYRASPRAIAAAAELQARMLGRAAGWVKPGGALVYSVCSLEPEEGEAIVAAFLRDHPDFAVEAPDAGVLPAGIAAGADGIVRVLPGALAQHGGADGFFVARLRRRR